MITVLPLTVIAFLVIIDTKVVSGHEINVSNNYTSTDKLYLLTIIEVYGGTDSADTVTASHTRQLDYYSGVPVTSSSYDGAIKKNSGTNAYWWLRSANSTKNNTFREVTSAGKGTNSG